MRPLTRWKPRSPVGAAPASASRLLLNTPPPSSGARTGARPALSAIPGPCGVTGPAADLAASDSVSGCMLAARLLYQRRKAIATRTKTARPATPPTMPPARTDAGGVLLLVLSLVVLAAELDAADADAAAVPVATPPAIPEPLDEEAAVDVAAVDVAVVAPDEVDSVEEDESVEDEDEDEVEDMDSVESGRNEPYEVVRSPLDNVVTTASLASARVANDPSERVATVVA